MSTSAGCQLTSSPVVRMGRGGTLCTGSKPSVCVCVCVGVCTQVCLLLAGGRGWGVLSGLRFFIHGRQQSQKTRTIPE